MEPPRGFLASLWNFICFLPYFIGLLFLGTIKGIIFCPFICLVMTIGNSAIILGLWPFHTVGTYYSIVRAKQLGPVLKLVLCLFLPVLLILWPVIGIVGSVIGGVLYGFLSPIFATFDAVGEGKSNQLLHCFYDGTISTVKGSFTVVRDFGDVCYHSYFSILDDLRNQEPPDGKYLEIRLLYLFGAVVVATLGIVVDYPMISLIALFKSPYMLFKGWHRLFHDLIGREGPFLETICVPFAGLAILLWPLAVVGAVLGSVVSSIFLGAYAGIVVYQESSFWFGLSYIVASLAIYDEYSNDILDMPEGSCFPRPRYRKKVAMSRTASHTSSFSRPNSFKRHPSRSGSLKNPMIDLKPLELLESLFKESRRRGEIFVSGGVITPEDIEDAKSDDGSKVISIGLPAYCLLQALLRSVNANSSGILLSDEVTEITTTNRPKDTVFDWFLNPFLIIKEQIKAVKLSTEEEDYLGKLVLLNGDPERLKNSFVGSPPESERRRAELDALARRLRGITKSVSRYPTFRRHFDSLVKTLSEDLAKKDGGSSSLNGPQRVSRSKSAFARMFSSNSFKGRSNNNGSDQESVSQSVVARDVDIA
ncbi:hypothetical protein HS088_TW06G01092 [Tripterygium wilfordii]|uniref:Transmembrane protein n=1 Tax=Tripterygium wilfordii TaxID=458696 RepID=A0A7J7DLF0_TRIWF|nr:uncharacterized membrane protein At3g27390 [Tripterygium wilfordii]XP_038702688.1 uncharacterized membrane protein At3g27390 [Tripterygium wilfordii]XP_038702689.1 uncharacterized membrane protein At3g27390 [Tripterygium wilfordii]KAF5746916.1 hypothetical protein HS088_TW06G01092 [Tripterygium wilfordii]